MSKRTSRNLARHMSAGLCIMSLDLYRLIVQQLAEVDYHNRLSLHNNNEPFLDTRLTEMIGIARKELPSAYLQLKSNGKALTKRKLYEVFDAGLDMRYINDYRPWDDVKQGKATPNVSNIIDELLRSRRFKGHFAGGHYYRRVIVSLWREDEIKGPRAGTAPNRDAVPTIRRPCLRPLEMVTISPNGLVGICIEDVLFAEPIGDVNREKLFDIWMSQSYIEIRKKLLAGDRSVKSTCQRCDYSGFTAEILEERGV